MAETSSLSAQDQATLASIAIALHTHLATSGEMLDDSDPAVLAAIALAVHTALGEQGQPAAPATLQSPANRPWVVIGRSLQIHTWQRS
ncbi:MAG: hypothetical protein FWF75_02455 [Propionibacteriaceae bacterium]|nr:hypothetical protein [Propionibacteriaceae bacterium]